MTEHQQNFPRTDEDLRLDRDAARQELGETVEALAHKLDVKSRVKENVEEKLDQATAKVADVVSQPAADRMRHGVDTIRANPLRAFAALLALILVIRLAAGRKKN